jgi:heme exporter protein B
MAKAVTKTPGKPMTADRDTPLSLRSIPEGDKRENGKQTEGEARVRDSGNFIKAVSAVLWKDLQAEFRSRELFSAMLVFSLLIILIFNFALELDIKTRQSVTSGVLWATFAFAGTLGLNRSMAIEKDRGCLDGLLLAPVDRSAIYFGKVLSNLVFMLIVEAVVLPVYSVLYNINLFRPGLLIVILLGSIGYVAVGTLLAAMSVQTRMRDILLPILLFPVAIPVLLAAVKASGGILANVPYEEIQFPINLLIAYDLIFIAVAFMTFENIVEE